MFASLLHGVLVHEPYGIFQSIVPYCVLLKALYSVHGILINISHIPEYCTEVLAFFNSSSSVEEIII
jgi:hypothetical protein